MYDFSNMDFSGLGDFNMFGDLSGMLQGLNIDPAAIAAYAEPAPVAAPVAAPTPTYADVPGLGSIPIDFSSFMPEDYAAAAQAVPENYQYIPETTVTPEPVSGIGAAPDYLSDINPADLAGDIYIDGIGYIPIGALSGQAPIDAPPNYKVKPVSGLDPMGLTLQEKDGRKGFNFVTNKAAIAGFVPVIEGATYQLWNERGKNKVWASGTGEEGLRSVYAAAQDLSARDGKKANWGVKVQLPGQTEWIRVVEDDPGKGFVGGALDVLGDAALGFVVGGPIGAVAAAGLSAAGVNVTDIAAPIIGAALLGPVGGAFVGSAVGSVAQGRSLEESFIRAGLSAVTAGAIETIPGAREALGSVAGELGIDKVVSSGLLPEVSSALGGIASAPVTGAGGEIVVQGLGGLPASATTGAIGGTISSQLASQYPEIFGPSSSTPPPQETSFPTEVSGIGDEIVVTGAGQQAIADAAAAAAGATTGQLAGIGGTQTVEQPVTKDQVDQKFDETFPQEDIVVTAARNARIDAAAAAILSGNTVGNEALDGLTDAEFAEAQRRAEIVAEAEKPPVVTPPTAGIGGGAGSVIPETVGTEDIVSEGQKETPTTGPSDLVKDTTKTTDETKADDTTKDGDDGKGLTTKDYIRMALAAPQLLSGIGGLLGAGESNDRFIAESSPLSYSPLNREQTIAGGSGAAPAFNVFTYGQDLPAAQRGEFQFFKPYDMKAAPQQYTAATTVPIYTQADVDARNAQITSDYNAKAADFNAYQDTLASQVTSGAMTPEAAAAAAQQYAAGLGSSAAAPALAEGGEVDDDMVKHLVSYSQGGGHKGPGKVKGIGSGQEDLIPAWLSDGEYVWSAQDVADLGDGSTDEGVRRLDKMREMVRKGAGRKQTKKIAKPQPGLDKMLKAVGGPV